MDTLSNSVTTFQVPKNPFNPTHHHHHHHHQLPIAAASNTHATSSISNTKPPFTSFYPAGHNNYRRKTTSSVQLPPLKLNANPPRASTVHRRAASGYAAALVDVALRNGVVLKVERDVKRVLRLLRNNGQIRDFMMDELVEEREKREIVKELMEKGKFEGHLVNLVKMVVEKGKRVEMVIEVLEEFERIFYELTFTATLPAT